jgi:hypothetical protein
MLPEFLAKIRDAGIAAHPFCEATDKRVHYRRESCMEKFLNDYIGRVSPEYSRIPENTAHVIASAFFAFKFELYQKTRRECKNALLQLPDGGGNDAVKKALAIVQSYAEAYENSQVLPEPVLLFTPAEHAFLAVTLPPEVIEDPATLDLDNALILLYAVALASSPDDEQALEEHRNYIITLLEPYKRLLGLQ